VVAGLVPENRSMVIAKFPVGTAQTVGRFWVAAGPAPATRSDGFCKVDSSGISIEVAEPLTPGFDAVPIANGVAMRQGPEPYDLIVHGTIPLAPRELTFFGARTATRHRTSLPFGDVQDEDPQLHRLLADWCIVGTHVPSPSTTFEGFRIRLTHLELWAGLNGMDMQIKRDKPIRVSMNFEPPGDITVPFVEFDEDATLRLSTVGTVPGPNVWGGRIRTMNLLAVEGLSGWTLAEMFDRFIRPVQALMTILAGERSEILDVEVKVGERWCAVFGDAVKRQAEQPTDDRAQMLLTRESFPLEAIAAWCRTSALLTPTPQVISAAMSGAFQTVDAEALALTTTAEGMDAMLYPDSRRFSVEEVEAAKRALRKSEVPLAVRNELSSALGTYLYKDSYPIRMKRLATEVSAASAGCVGDPDRWKDAMRRLRNDLAHSNRDAEADAEERLLAMHAASRSLRWALKIRLLQHAGVSPAVLSAALSASKRFRRDAGLWRGLFEGADRKGR
jgi:hypothetical protein